MFSSHIKCKRQRSKIVARQSAKATLRFSRHTERRRQEDVSKSAAAHKHMARRTWQRQRALLNFSTPNEIFAHYCQKYLDAKISAESSLQLKSQLAWLHATQLGEEETPCQAHICISAGRQMQFIIRLGRDPASSQGRSPDEMVAPARSRGYPPHTQTFGVFLINTFLARSPVVEEDPPFHEGEGVQLKSDKKCFAHD